MAKRLSTQATPTNIQAALQILEGIPHQLEKLSRGLAQEELVRPLGEGERSFSENMAHLINCDARGLDPIYYALLLKQPFIVRIHPERQWGKLLRYDRFDFADLLAYFSFNRRKQRRIFPHGQSCE